MASSDRAEPIYLDHNATTPVAPQVRDEMLRWLGGDFGNPSSGHPYGRRAADAVARSRQEVADIIGASASEIYFTGGGTEADNIAVRGPRVSLRRIVISAVEHPAVEAPAGVLERQGWQRSELPVTSRGVVDLQACEPILNRPAGIVSVILAQNETGVVQPIAEIAKRARAAHEGVVVHTDAAQAVGKVPVNVDDLGVDLLTVVSHKLYGPCGIGALYVRTGVEIEPVTVGGGQERGLRPGTEPVALIVGLAAACRLARLDLEQEAERVKSLRDELWGRLRGGVPGIVWTAEQAPCLPNTLHVRFPGVAGERILKGAQNVAASTGSACHQGDASASGVLGAMGLSADQAQGAVRLSLGRKTSSQDIAAAADALVAAFATAANKPDR